MLPTAATNALSRRVNELFHDLEGADYETVHPEIFKREQERWTEVCHRFIAGATHPLTCLDIGCGTGFVGTHLLPVLPKESTLICADISREMLRVCEEKLTPIAGTTHLQFLKMETEKLGCPDASVDVVTMNSVLHHMADDTLFLQEIERVLKPGGIVCIGHEPNSLFFRSQFLHIQANLFHDLTPKRIAARILRAMGLYNTVVHAPQESRITREINATLLAEHLIEKPLSGHEISMLVDIHSPTAGGLRLDEGFDPLTVLHVWKSPSEILFLETYNHLLKMSDRGSIRRLYGRVLNALFPKNGSTFFLVARKLAASTHAS